MSESEKGWPKVAIVILNWNGWRDTVERVDSGRWTCCAAWVAREASSHTEPVASRS